MSVTLDVVDEPIAGLGADGRPDPAYAARLGLVPATAGRRSAAFALDATVWILLAIPGAVGVALLLAAVAEQGDAAAALATGDLGLPLVLIAVSQGLLAIFGIVQLTLHGRKSFTLGKAAFGLRSVSVVTFSPPGFWRVVLRALVLFAGQLAVPFVGPAILFASSSWDPEQRGRSWLDRVGRCYVIDVRRGLNPLDAKALRHARRALDTPAASEAVRLPSLASDRSPHEELFIPSSRSSSGVVSASPSEVGAWTPPPLGDSGTSPSTVSAPPAVVLEFDDGTRVAVSGSGLLGRSPASPPGEPSAQLVPLVDDSMRISKTHAAFGVDAHGFWIADRASKNGTVVEPPGRSARDLEPGVRTSLPNGTRVTLGGRSFTVSVDSGRQA